MRTLEISLLKQAVEEGKIHINIDFDDELHKITHDICFQTLLNIREILDNQELSDFDCIERIVCALEDINFGGGSRHDFG